LEVLSLYKSQHLSSTHPLPIMSGMHSHDGVHFHASHGHSHDLPAADHGHTHEVLDGPGSYMGREMPIIEGRDWSERAFTVGIGG
jgi:urease accessory protein